MSRAAEPDVVLIAREVTAPADAVLTYATDAVACTSKKQGICLYESFFGEACSKVVDAVTSDVLAGEDACPAGCTDGGSDKGIREQDTVCRQVIHVRCLDYWITHTSKRIPALVVGQQKDYVRRFGR